LCVFLPFNFEHSFVYVLTIPIYPAMLYIWIQEYCWTNALLEEITIASYQQTFFSRLYYVYREIYLNM